MSSKSNFTIPAVAAISFCLIGGTSPAAAVAWGQCQGNELAKLTASDAATFDEFGRSVSIDGDVLVIGASRDDDAGSHSGSAYVYRFDGTDWVEEAKLTATDAAPADQFGAAVSISGDVALIGAFRDDDAGLTSGSAYVFRYDSKTGVWNQEAKLTASDAAEGDYFGISISVEGDVALIGAREDDDAGWGSGAAYVFRFDGSTWIEEAKLTASDATAGDLYGWGVSISGDVALIAAYGDDDACPGDPEGYCGSAYIYRFDPDTLGWIEEAKLTASDAEPLDKFGSSVSITGGLAVIGARNEGNSGHHDDSDGQGAAYVFRFDGSTWIEEAKLTASDAAMYDEFGLSVAIRDDVALIGAFREGKGLTGSAYVFRLDPQTSEWIEEAKLTASDAEPLDRFGLSVSLSGDAAVIGAMKGDADGAQSSGSAYVFVGLSDCNENGELDLCDIADGTSSDDNNNGIPDECEPPDCPWDVNDDGVVDHHDLVEVVHNLGLCDDSDNCPWDVNGDGIVNGRDVAAVAMHFGACP